MTLGEAIAVLKTHNLWRRGEIEEDPHTPEEVGEAIDRVVYECELENDL